MADDRSILISLRSDLNATQVPDDGIAPPMFAVTRCHRQLDIPTDKSKSGWIRTNMSGFGDRHTTIV